MMKQKELIKRVLKFDNPERIGLALSNHYPSDLCFLPLSSNNMGWSNETSIKSEVPGFKGQVMKDSFGNIWGRLENVSKGEVIKGALENGWEGLRSYRMPVFGNYLFQSAREMIRTNEDKFLIGSLSGFPFTIMRNIRGLENFLADLLLEQENVMKLGEMAVEYLEQIIDGYSEIGADGVMFWEDWGSQNSLMISPALWRQIFKPWYQRLARRVHEKNMYLFMHSCGYTYDIIGDLIEAGVDAIQVQVHLIGLEKIGRDFGGKITFYCVMGPLDLLQSGNKEMIEKRTRDMIKLLGGFNGGFIAADYSQWSAIEAGEENLQMVHDIFTNEGWY